MRVTVVYLGGSRGQAGCAREALELPPGATIGGVAAAVAAAHPALAPLLDRVRWARNFELAELGEAVADGDELGVLPPVAGGVGRAEIRSGAIGVDEVLQRVRHPSRGGIVCFVGTVRDNADGKPVARLAYEAYEPMATRSLERIAAALSHDGCEVAIVHRTGTLELGTVSVVIAAAAPHREAAFFACREALERLKRDVPIWKREESPTGDRWVGWGGG